MNKENYILQVSRRLSCESSRKKEITDQLYSDIESALEQGESWEDIELRLGTPDEMAEEFNENLAGDVPQAAAASVRGRRIGAAVIIFLLLCVAAILISGIYRGRENGPASPRTTPQTWPVSDEEAITLAEAILKNYNSENYTAITDLNNDRLKSELTPAVLRDTRRTYLKNAGSYQSTGNTSVTHTKEKSTYYTIVQLLAMYEKQQVLFTITLDENKRLAGFYLR